MAGDKRRGCYNSASSRKKTSKNESDHTARSNSSASTRKKTWPNMATITASLQNCSLSNHHQRGGTSRNSTAGIAPPDGISDSSENTNTNFNNNNNPSNDATVELNSEIALPYHWEQCLDLKTGEIYYLNWRTGMRVSEDPRTNVVAEDQVYSEEDDEDDEDDDDDNNSYDSEETYSEELPSLSSSRAENTVPQINILTTEALRRAAPPSVLAAPTLVLGGCKACLMYFMVPKEVEECPRCGRQLLHFDDQN